MTTPGRARVQVNIRSFSFKIRYVNVARSGRIPFKKNLITQQLHRVIPDILFSHIIPYFSIELKC